MNVRCFLFTSLIILNLSSCKKERLPSIEKPLENAPSTISYREINQTLKVTDAHPINLDVNKDGIIDCSYFMQHVISGGKIHMYVGVNPVYGSSTSADPQNDNEFLNMGLVHALLGDSEIKEDLAWTDNHSLLSVWQEQGNGSKTYWGNWSNGQDQMMPVRLVIKGKNHYAWVKLKFNKLTEELMILSTAWNTIAQQKIKAGEI